MRNEEVEWTEGDGGCENAVNDKVRISQAGRKAYKAERKLGRLIDANGH